MFGVSGTSAGSGWAEAFWEEWVSSLLCGVSETLSLKLNRGEVSAVVGEDGPALETVLDGPLLSAGTEMTENLFKGAASSIHQAHSFHFIT